MPKDAYHRTRLPFPSRSSAFLTLAGAATLLFGLGLSCGDTPLFEPTPEPEMPAPQPAQDGDLGQLRGSLSTSLNQEHSSSAWARGVLGDLDLTYDGVMASVAPNPAGGRDLSLVLNANRADYLVNLVIPLPALDAVSATPATLTLSTEGYENGEAAAGLYLLPRNAGPSARSWAAARSGYVEFVDLERDGADVEAVSLQFEASLVDGRETLESPCGSRLMDALREVRLHSDSILLVSIQEVTHAANQTEVRAAVVETVTGVTPAPEIRFEHEGAPRAKGQGFALLALDFRTTRGNAYQLESPEDQLFDAAERLDEKGEVEAHTVHFADARPLTLGEIRSCLSE